MGFVAIEDYTSFYFNILFGLVLMTFFSTQTQSSKINSSLVLTRGLGIVFFGFTLVYIGFRPISGKFIDMMTYANIFERMASGDYTVSIDDPLFSAFTKFSSKVLTVELYFFVCTLLYVIPMYLVSKKWFKKYWFFSFLMLVCSLSFWNYGTNGIRNGMATSLFLLGISREKKVSQIFWIFIAYNFHKSIIIPAAAFAVSNIYNQPRKIIWFWILCIPLSIAGGTFWQNLFGGLGFEDKYSYLTTEADASAFSRTGFRWDFLLYSAAAVFTGWYFIHVKGFKDKIYFLIFNTYVIANAIWILVIQSNFSNRFAYLSWFMMAIVIAYPFLNENAIRQPLRKLGFILMAYFAFTYILMFLLK